MDKQETEVKEGEVIYKPEDFQKEYELLCKKMGILIVPSLVWVARDDGTWSTRVNLTVGKLPKQEQV
jgi:putative effector of murein hydrolase LrgA (UPF0299 family)